MAINNFSFSRLWTNPADFPTYEPDEATVRADMQALFNELAVFLNAYVVPRLNADESDISDANEAIADLVAGTVPDGTITNAKLHDGDSVTGNKFVPGTLLQRVTNEINLIERDKTPAGLQYDDSELEFYYSRALGIVFIRGFLWMTIAASGTNSVVLELSSYDPADGEDGAGIINASLVQGGRLLIAESYDSADVGQTYGIKVSGWYFCDVPDIGSPITAGE